LKLEQTEEALLKEIGELKRQDKVSKDEIDRLGMEKNDLVAEL
jgi:hypothetical protein